MISVSSKIQLPIFGMTEGHYITTATVKSRLVSTASWYILILQSINAHNKIQIITSINEL